MNAIMWKKRRELKLTQKMLADRIGCSQELISKAERGLPILEKWAKRIAVELNLDWEVIFKDV